MVYVSCDENSNGAGKAVIIKAKPTINRIFPPNKFERFHTSSLLNAHFVRTPNARFGFAFVPTYPRTTVIIPKPILITIKIVIPKSATLPVLPNKTAPCSKERIKTITNTQRRFTFINLSMLCNISAPIIIIIRINSTKSLTVLSNLDCFAYLPYLSEFFGLVCGSPFKLNEKDNP